MHAVAKIAWAVLPPANLLLILLALGVLALWLGRPRLGRALVTLVALAFAAIAVLPVGDWLLRPLEERFARPSPQPDRVAGIVLLGGAVDGAMAADRGTTGVNDHADRVLAAVALARRHPEARVLVASGEASLHPEGKPEASATAGTLAALGVARERILVDDRSRNTAENAVEAFAVARPLPDETWLLVTSAFHMPRAMGTFRRHGWTAIRAWPADYQTRSSEPGPPLGFDLRSGLERLRLAGKEWLGLVWYRALDRTDRLFPAP